MPHNAQHPHPPKNSTTAATPHAASIAIVGGGYSGALTAVHLLRHHQALRPLKVLLIEPRLHAARGLAYSIWDDSMLLNVPAGNMSALADDPAHFLHYCRALDPSLNGGSFVSRRMYGDYLQSVLAQAAQAAPGSLHCIHSEVLAVRPQGEKGGFQLALANGEMLYADQVVLSFGFQGPQPLPFAQPLAHSPYYLANPWNYKAMDMLTTSGPIALIGTGHTAIDALFRLTSVNPNREVLLLSRHGLLPKAHRTLAQAPVPTGFPSYLQAVPATALAFVRALRHEIARRQQAGHNWRDVLNELRPHTQAIWQAWPLAERRRFLLRLRPWWDIHRHRLAPVAAARLAAQLHTGRVQVRAGSIVQMAPHAGGVRLTLRERGSGTLQSLQVAAVVNCTGPDYDIRRATSPLLTQLREAGLITGDALQLGLEVDADYGVVGRAGQATPGLYYVGPMLRARLWEAIAIPELRTHTRQLADKILHALHHAPQHSTHP